MATKKKSAQSGASSDGPAGLYKSIFLRGKLEQQMDRRKKERKGPKAPGGGSPRDAPSATGAQTDTTGGKKKVATKNASKAENEEQLLQIIDDLKNDLRIRDEEFAEQRKYVEKLVEQNDYLKK